MEPGWFAAGAILIVNIVGWVINRSHSSKEEAQKEGKIMEGLRNLTLRVDRLEKRIDDFLTKGGR